MQDETGSAGDRLGAVSLLMRKGMEIRNEHHVDGK